MSLTVEVVGTCSICLGDIVKETEMISEGPRDPTMLMVGPGKRNQFSRVKYVEFYCKKCKVSYHRSIVEAVEKPIESPAHEDAEPKDAEPQTAMD